MKLISIVTPCYNEQENVAELIRQVRSVMATLPDYQFEHLFIDNCSEDRTVEILKQFAAEDRRIKIIINSRNFGHIRSPYYGYLQASGDAVISLAADFQDPPELIIDFVAKWAAGYKVVMAIRTESDESRLLYNLRRFYYKLIRKLSDVPLTENYSGFGLYDRRVIDALREMKDSYPYFRGLIPSIGFETTRVNYKQVTRRGGLTKNNFYTLYDLAMLGITNHSKIPLRLATMLGFLLSSISLLTAVIFFIRKLINWDNFTLGLAPLVIGLFFFSSVQLFFLGILGEYIGSIHTQVLQRPLVIEKERVNF